MTAATRRKNITPGHEAGAQALAPLRAFTPVTFTDPSEVRPDLPALPKAFQTRTAKAAPSGLSPAALWEHPGQEVHGTFRGARKEVGPNASRMYDVATEDGELVAVWGSAILDAKVDTLAPQPGDLIFIGYLGDVGGKEGRNPARDFHVVVVPQNAKK